MTDVDKDAALARLMRFLSVEGITGQEARIGKDVAAALRQVGVPAQGDAGRRREYAHSAADPDRQSDRDAARRGSRKAAAPLLFMTHLDTVPLCAGAKPKVQGRKIVNTANDRAGRRQPHRLRRAGDAGGRAGAPEARPPAADAAVHRARGERAVGRAAREAGGARRRRRWASITTAGSPPG